MTTFAGRFGPWAIVTGAAQGVGLAFTDELLERAVSVVMVDRDPLVRRVAAERAADRVVAVAVVADVAEPAWLDEVEAATAGREVGLAVANAGVAYVGPLLDMAAAERRRLLDVNCAAVADLAAWAVPPMVERGRGGFVATSSGSALAGTAGVGFYSATKAFVVNHAEALGWEVRDSGVVVRAVVAPSMATPMFAASGADPARMAAPAVDPRTVVAAALDSLLDDAQPTRWLPDDGLRFVDELDRATAVDVMSQATTAMYPDRFDAG